MRFTLIPLIFVLSACTTTPNIIPTEDTSLAWDDRKSSLYAQEHWIAHLSVIGVTEQEKFKTRIIWQQNPAAYQIKLRDFIGRTVALIDGSPSGVRVKTSKGREYVGRDAEQLIYELFGLRIPVTGLRYWLLGVPQPDVAYQELLLRADGLAASMQQQGWDLSYQTYVNSDTRKMPANAIFQYDDLTLTVKVSRWDLPTPH